MCLVTQLPSSYRAAVGHTAFISQLFKLASIASSSADGGLCERSGNRTSVPKRIGLHAFAAFARAFEPRREGGSQKVGIPARLIQLVSTGLGTYRDGGRTEAPGHPPGVRFLPRRAVSL
jgi:hypothetical protein